MTFINFQKWMEEATAAAAPAVFASSAAPQTSSPSSNSSGTLKGDVAKVPSKLGCVNCSKDFKNWYYKRRKRK